MYIMMINIHGLIRSKDIEFGRDADTGGQTRYILELTKCLSAYDDVAEIDLVTRQITDKVVSGTYSKESEELSPKAKIVRLSCGGKKYIRKEKLWPHLDEFTDKVIQYIQSQGRIPDYIHGHYADSAYVASRIASLFGIPLIFTAHSLGRNKLSFLESQGMSNAKAVQEYAIDTRIKAEEEILSQADLVVTSTNFEKDELFSQYAHRNLPRYSVIPPGAELEKFFPYYNYEIAGSEINEETKQAHMRVSRELQRFLFEPNKPLILTLCRPDARKNIDLLIDVYGNDKELQAIANLAVFAGIRDDISTMEEGEQQVLTEILLAMDRYDLYGKMAVPKYHNPEKDVPEMYRIAALSGGIFVSTSFLETFGLTFIEASACGLPFVATNKGGPVDIEENCRSGKLVNIGDRDSISSAIKAILTDSELWNRLSEQGVNRTREVYTWNHHCRSYLEQLKSLNIQSASFTVEKEFRSIGKRIQSMKEMLIVDIDDTLLGDRSAVKPLLDFLKEKKGEIGFGVATGRDIKSALQALKENGITNVEFIIASVGTEIYYFDEKIYDTGWSAHIRNKWKPAVIKETLGALPGLMLQDITEAQRDFKISYDLLPSVAADEIVPKIHNELMKRKLSYNLIHSHGTMIDILPYRASKGKAIRYLSHKWKIPMQNIYTAGNSGNDTDMLTGSMKGIVVGNHEPELETLKNRRLIYFSKEKYAAAILDGIQYWKKNKIKMEL